MVFRIQVLRILTDSSSIWSQSIIKIFAVSSGAMFLLLLFKQYLVNPKAVYAEKAMAPHSSTLAWRIPGTGEPGGLLSMGLHRVGHD